MTRSTPVARSRRLACVPIVAFAAVVGLVPVRGTAEAVSVTVNRSDGGAPIANYRWTVEEDRTFHVVPGVSVDATLSVILHPSYMPVVASGSTFDGPSPSLPSIVALDPGKHYFVSVLPEEGYSNSGAPVAPGQTSVTVTCNKLPLPTAQISILVFEDTQPCNNVPEFTERGLEGFTVKIVELAGHQLTDAFGNPLGTTYVPNSYPAVVAQMGSGVITTGPDGTALVKNLYPGKYGVQVIPPAGQGWSQTSTIEGTKTVDAWVRHGEPPFFYEYGVVPHTWFGFVKPTNNTSVLTGGSTISGRIVDIHNDGPPFYALNAGTPFDYTRPWVGLNSNPVGVGELLWAQRANADGTFYIPNVPTGSYEVVVWDDFLDLIWAFKNVVVTAPTPVNLDPLAVFDWFQHLHGVIFEDYNEDGFRDPGEPGIPGQAMNIRFRDGTIYQSYTTNPDGFVRFDEAFPYFNWQIAEVDFAKFKPTGMTTLVDAGGAVDPPTWDPTLVGLPSRYAGLLNPAAQPENGGANYRTIKAPPEHPAAPLLLGFQGIAGQTNVILWGKNAYPQIGDQDNPPYCETWDWDNTRKCLHPDCATPGGGLCPFPGPGDLDDGCTWESLYDLGDPDYGSCPISSTNGTFEPGNGGIAGIVYYTTTRAENDPRFGTGEEWEPGIPGVTVRLYDAAGTGLLYETQTDSFDDNQPTGCLGAPFVHGSFTTDCFDALRNFNQIREGVFDGGFAFDARVLSAADGSPCGDSLCGDPVEVPGLPAGDYVVEVVPPPGYELQKEEDKNVDFGDELFPPSDAEPVPILTPECVGAPHTLPAQLDLFPGVDVVLDPQMVDIEPGTPDTVERPLCDRKLTTVRDGQNAAPNFFLFTKAPVTGHAKGLVLDDLAPEASPVSLSFGEQHGVPYLPVSFRDSTNREINRVYTDEFGSYDALVPGTYNINPPQPSGVAPNVFTVCLNDPTMPDPANPNQRIPDPYFNRGYGQICLNFQFVQGTTTYLDTPVVPVAAFVGNTFPVDCEFQDHTPVIYSVSGPATAGPYVPSGAGPHRTITIVSVGNVQVANPAFDGISAQPALITRDYGFGTSTGTVTIGGVRLTNVVWGAGVITGRVPTNARTGVLAVTRGDNRRTSTVGVTVTVGTTAVRYVAPGGSIQAAIDAANNDDLIIVPPGVYEELPIMWKPVRLQGWGAGSTMIDAKKQAVQKLLDWRAKVAGLIGSGSVSLLPGQTDIGARDGEGPGIFVLAKDATVALGGYGLVGPIGSQRPNSRIDGLHVTGADLAGGVWANGFAHYLEISNNRIAYNQGLYGGGIRLGHAGLNGYDSARNDRVNMHHNQVVLNGALADDNQGAAGGGISMYAGSDFYRVTNNFICGNFAQSDGGGVAHMGLSNSGRIANNTIIFNESFSQGQTVSGGGIFVGGGPPLNGDTISPGSGSVAINANLIQGNHAGGGDGGGIRLDQVNGADVVAFPTLPSRWFSVNVFNNMIVDNVAALAGGGISLQDTARANITHNTIANNDSTAVAGLAFISVDTSTPQPAGVVGRAHTTVLRNAMDPSVRTTYANPTFINNIIWQNRSFNFAPDPTAPPGQLPYGLFPNPATSPPRFWDLGVLGAGGGARLTPLSSILTPASMGAINTTGYDPSNIAGPPSFIRQYFNTRPGVELAAGPEFILTPFAFDEGGNAIRARYGPITYINPATGLSYGDYHVRSPAWRGRANNAITYPDLARDYDNQVRPRPTGTLPDIGADEIN